MPRFGTRSLLVGFAVVALWLATFYWPDPSLTGPGGQTRRALLLVVLVASGIAAVCYRGRMRAFWSAFFVTMLLLSVDVLNGHYRPDCVSIASDWSMYLSRNFNFNSDVRIRVLGVIWHALVLGISTMSGLVAAWVYDQSRKAAR